MRQLRGLFVLMLLVSVGCGGQIARHKPVELPVKPSLPVHPADTRTAAELGELSKRAVKVVRELGERIQGTSVEAKNDADKLLKVAASLEEVLGAPEQPANVDSAGELDALAHDLIRAGESYRALEKDYTDLWDRYFKADTERENAITALEKKQGELADELNRKEEELREAKRKVGFFGMLKWGVTVFTIFLMIACVIGATIKFKQLGLYVSLPIAVVVVCSIVWAMWKEQLIKGAIVASVVLVGMGIIALVFYLIKYRTALGRTVVGVANELEAATPEARVGLLKTLREGHASDWVRNLIKKVRKAEGIYTKYNENGEEVL